MGKDDLYIEKNDIVKAEDIIKLREKYSISQRELTAILGFGKMTINRYENGGNPTKSQSDYIKLLIENEDEFIKKAKEAYDSNNISKKTYEKIVLKEKSDNFKAIIEKVSSRYIEEKEKNIVNNELFNFITNDIENILYKTGIINNKQYIVRGSAGKGQWAIIPWIAIFDEKITNTAQKGYYIVYLFSADMRKVYLSLNQGWTYFKEQYGVKEGKKKIRTISSKLQNKLKSGLNEFDCTSIDLEYKGNGSTLPMGYELGHICGKEYTTQELPDNQTLINDLQNMISVYRELKGYILEDNYLTLNNHLLAENTIEQEEKKENKEDIDIDEILATEGVNTKLIKTDELPKIFEEKIQENKVENSIRNNNQSTNYQEKNKKQEKIGRAGEYLVIEYEKDKLKEKGINKDVEHVAITQKDKAGYDIKSYDENGEEIYIEVKTTKKGINEPFYLTKTELEFCKKHKQKYILYRIYNFKPSKKTGEFYTITGDISEIMNLETEVYIVKGRKN